jgi:hypothetical protein
MTSIFGYKKSTANPLPDIEENSDLLGYKNPMKVNPYQQPELQEEEPGSFTEKSYKQIRESEELEKEIERNAARGVSRMGERLAGLPGDLVGFAMGLFGAEELNPIYGSQDLKKFSEKSTLGYTKPRNKLEEVSDELLGDVASMYVGKASKTFLGALGKVIGTPLAGSAVKEGLKAEGVDEKSSSWAKAGTMLFLDLLSKGKGGSKKYIGDLFSKGESAIPNGTVFAVPVLEQEVKALKTVLNRGGSSSRTTKALQKIDEIEGKIVNGHIDPKELPAFRKTINAAIDDLGGWDMATSPANRKEAIRHLNEVKDAIIKEAERYGQTNPQFLEAWRMANEAASVAGKSNKISNFIEKVVGKKAGSVVKSLFGIGGASTLLSPSTALLAGTLTGAYQAFKLGYRVVNSPTLRKYYKNIVTGALRDNAAQVSANAKALEQKIKEEDEEEKKKIKSLLK